MATGMITKGTEPQWIDEERSPIAIAIATILMQARAGSISMEQAAKFFEDMVGRGVPPQMIENEIDKDMMAEGSSIGAPTVDQMATEVRTPRPTMPTYGDVRSVLDPGSNVTPHVDQPDIGWPGEDFRKFPKAEVKKMIPAMGDDFGTPPVNRNVVGRAAPPVSSYVRPVGTPLEEKAKYMAGPPMPTFPNYEIPKFVIGQQPPIDPFAFEDAKAASRGRSRPSTSTDVKTWGVKPWEVWRTV